MKTKREIIEETASLYSLSNRASNVDGCVYLTQEGKTCAVGRCLINPQIFMDTNVGAVNEIDSKHLDQYLKEEYRGHSMEFWIYLQRLHDIQDYWNKKGLSRKGKEQYKMLLKEFS